MEDNELDAPKEILLDDFALSVDFHPSQDILVLGCISGDVILYSYSIKEDNEVLRTRSHHKNSCRSVKFSPSGDRFHTISKDKSIWSIDTETGKVKRKLKEAHEEAIYSLLVSDENILVTGDDDGTIKVWDMRTKNCVFNIKEHEDYISDMIIDEQKKILIASSGDGTISAFNIRRKRLDLQSEMFDSELLCLAPVRHEKKLVCGSAEGAINIFNWGEWGNISDRFPGHPASIDCIARVSEDVICTGCSDGIIRAVHILPNRFMGVVGAHEDFPVESLSMSHDRKFLASSSHDQKVKFWNVDGLEDIVVKEKKKGKKKDKLKPLPSSKRDNFFSGLMDNNGDDDNENEDSDEDDSDSSDDGDSDESDDSNSSESDD